MAGTMAPQAAPQQSMLYKPSPAPRAYLPPRSTYVSDYQASSSLLNLTAVPESLTPRTPPRGAQACGHRGFNRGSPAFARRYSRVPRFLQGQPLKIFVPLARSQLAKVSVSGTWGLATAPASRTAASKTSLLGKAASGGWEAHLC